MNVVTIIMNSIHSIHLKHRPFKAPPDGIESKYSDINTEEHWLSTGKLHSRFLEIIPQIQEFLESRIVKYKQQTNPY
jgi:hypothetical protein